MRTEQRILPLVVLVLLGRCRRTEFGIVTAISVSVPSCMSRIDAVNVLDTLVLPLSEKGTRIQLSAPIHDGILPNNTSSQVLTSTDPRLFQTYGEFPLSSLDVLLDRLVELRDIDCSACFKGQPFSRQRRLNVIDLGSGCGRLALYMALTRPNWHVVGIEQSVSLHQEAMHAVERTVALGHMVKPSLHSDFTGWADERVTSRQSQNDVTLLRGDASTWVHLIRSADVVVCYSTAFENSHFSESIAALVLSKEWNDIITPQPTTGRVIPQSSSHTDVPLWCITTDKALDPNRGWIIVDRVDVPNPEVFESTGFIQKFDSNTHK